MDPGQACITCHTIKKGPAFKIAGTIYPTAHEPDDCYGIGGPLNVIVTDANGTVTTIKVGASGNFSSRAAIVPPFHVKVTDGVKERAMAGALTAGDCNSCHTEQGLNGAPGRIVAP
jgi:mono/diheme cytochrome c family protein